MKSPKEFNDFESLYDEDTVSELFDNEDEHMKSMYRNEYDVKDELIKLGHHSLAEAPEDRLL
ncbi:hypothetical protein [Paenibacillus sp. IHBB 10380]|uniref:hypothetical protein n=1 Tax=Paenibacillus sp. IHBB 10380 TaxID=1566358 RepID=UPI0005CF9F24|nr:hypothetical protein [Paenibacillus sp. IHBB 10380]AJS59012.1 hypothetical protein UB51_11645 [Paenibacillus sp. IHBB 10380]